jgi:hypothetical protein
MMSKIIKIVNPNRSARRWEVGDVDEPMAIINIHGYDLADGAEVTLESDTVSWCPPTVRATLVNGGNGERWLQCISEPRWIGPEPRLPEGDDEVRVRGRVRVTVANPCCTPMRPRRFSATMVKLRPRGRS